MTTKKPKFLRRSADKYSKLGKKRKKKQKWKNPNGRDNKMREKRRGYPAVVSIGYKSKKDREENPIIKNIQELLKTEKKEVILGKIGKKKKLEILEKAKEIGIKILNINEKKYLKKSKQKTGEIKK